MHTARAPSLCTPPPLQPFCRRRCASAACAEAKDDVYGRARSEMFGVGLESEHDHLPQRLRSALRKSSPWSAASADLNGAPPPPPLPNDRRPRVRTPVGQRPSSSPCSCTHTCTACAPAAHAPRCWQRILLTTNNPGAQVLQAAADARARALCYVWAVLGSLPARARAQGAVTGRCTGRTARRAPRARLKPLDIAYQGLI